MTRRKGPRLTLPEIIRIVGACGAVIAVVRAEVDAAKAATTDGKVTPATIRRAVLRVLGLPEDLPKGPVMDLVEAFADALGD